MEDAMGQMRMRKNIMTLLMYPRPMLYLIITLPPLPIDMRIAHLCDVFLQLKSDCKDEHTARHADTLKYDLSVAEIRSEP